MLESVRQGSFFIRSLIQNTMYLISLTYKITQVTRGPVVVNFRRHQSHRHLWKYGLFD